MRIAKKNLITVMMAVMMAALVVLAIAVVTKMDPRGGGIRPVYSETEPGSGDGGGENSGGNPGGNGSGGVIDPAADATEIYTILITQLQAEMPVTAENMTADQADRIHTAQGLYMGMTDAERQTVRALSADYQTLTAEFERFSAPLLGFEAALALFEAAPINILNAADKDAALLDLDDKFVGLRAEQITYFDLEKQRAIGAELRAYREALTSAKLARTDYDRIAELSGGLRYADRIEVQSLCDRAHTVYSAFHTQETILTADQCQSEIKKYYLVQLPALAHVTVAVNNGTKLADTPLEYYFNDPYADFSVTADPGYHVTAFLINDAGSAYRVDLTGNEPDQILRIGVQSVQVRTVPDEQILMPSFGVDFVEVSWASGTVSVAFSDLADWQNADQQGLYDLGADEAYLYAGYRFSTPAGAAYTSWNERTDDPAEDDGIWEIYFKIAKKSAGKFLPLQGWSGEDLFYFYDSNKQLIAVYRVPAVIADYTEYFSQRIEDAFDALRYTEAELLYVHSQLLSEPLANIDKLAALWAGASANAHLEQEAQEFTTDYPSLEEALTTHLPDAVQAVAERVTAIDIAGIEQLLTAFDSAKENLYAIAEALDAISAQYTLLSQPQVEAVNAVLLDLAAQAIAAQPAFGTLLSAARTLAANTACLYQSEAMLEEALAGLTESDYTPENWQRILNLYNEALGALQNGETAEAIEDLYEKYETLMRSVLTIAQQTEQEEMLLIIIAMEKASAAQTKMEVERDYGADPALDLLLTNFNGMAEDSLTAGQLYTAKELFLQGIDDYIEMREGERLVLYKADAKAQLIVPEGYDAADFAAVIGQYAQAIEEANSVAVIEAQMTLGKAAIAALAQQIESGRLLQDAIFDALRALRVPTGYRAEDFEAVITHFTPLINGSASAGEAKRYRELALLEMQRVRAGIDAAALLADARADALGALTTPEGYEEEQFAELIGKYTDWINNAQSIETVAVYKLFALRDIAEHKNALDAESALHAARTNAISALTVPEGYEEEDFADILAQFTALIGDAQLTSEITFYAMRASEQIAARKLAVDSQAALREKRALYLSQAESYLFGILRTHHNGISRGRFTAVVLSMYERIRDFGYSEQYAEELCAKYVIYLEKLGSAQNITELENAKLIFTEFVWSVIGLQDALNVAQHKEVANGLIDRIARANGKTSAAELSAIRAEYNGLGEQTKMYVTNYARLVQLETLMSAAQSQETDIPYWFIYVILAMVVLSFFFLILNIVLLARKRRLRKLRQRQHASMIEEIKRELLEENRPVAPQEETQEHTPTLMQQPEAVEAEETVQETVSDEEEADADAEDEEEAEEAVRSLGQETPISEGSFLTPLTTESSLRVRPMKKSFDDLLTESEDKLKQMYSELKNLLLRYKKVRARVSSKTETYRMSRVPIAKMFIMGKALRLYLALDPDAYDVQTYHHKNAGDKTKYAEVPFLMRIRSERMAKKAKELITAMMENLGAEINPKRTDEDYVKLHLNPVSTKLGEKGMSNLILSAAGVEDAIFVNDNLAERCVQLIELEADPQEAFVRENVSIEQLNAHFSSGDIVDQKALKQKKLIAKETNYIKITAEGILTKALTVVADSYAMDAVKIILLTGGSPVRYKRTSKLKQED